MPRLRTSFPPSFSLNPRWAHPTACTTSALGSLRHPSNSTCPSQTHDSPTGSSYSPPHLSCTLLHEPQPGSPPDTSLSLPSISRPSPGTAHFLSSASFQHLTAGAVISGPGFHKSAPSGLPVLSRGPPSNLFTSQQPECATSKRRSIRTSCLTHWWLPMLSGSRPKPYTACKALLSPTHPLSALQPRRPYFHFFDSFPPRSLCTGGSLSSCPCLTQIFSSFRSHVRGPLLRETLRDPGV